MLLLLVSKFDNEVKKKKMKIKSFIAVFKKSKIDINLFSTLMRKFTPHNCWRKSADFLKLCSSTTAYARNTTRKPASKLPFADLTPVLAV